MYEFINMCNQGTSWMGKILEYDLNDDKQRQYSTAIYVECKFAVKIIWLDDTRQYIEIWMNPNHTSNERRSKVNVFFFTVALKCN